jgi:hypothetical protein
MIDTTDVIQLLADSRPAYLDAGTDPAVRQDHLRRALTEPSSSLASEEGEQLARIGVPDRPLHRRTGLRVGVGLTAAATVAAITVATGGFHGTPTPTAGSGGGQVVAGRAKSTPAKAQLGVSQILLLAADQVRAAPTTGKYWRTTTELRGLELAGPKNDPYTLEGGDVDEIWAARADSGTSWGVGRGLGYKPATSADLAAWKRDGSPKIVDMHEAKSDGKDSVLTGVSIAASKEQVVPTNPDSEIFSIGGKDKSMRDVRELPADPTALRKVLLQNYQRSVDATKSLKRAVGPAWTEDQWLFNTATDVLTLPVTPQVRASTYRILAGLGSVHSLGRVTDVKGRPGNAVAIQDTGSLGLQEDRLIIDPTTGLLLAQETRVLKPVAAMSWLKPTDVWQTSVVTRIGWTNDRPPARTKYVPSANAVG